MPRFSVKLMDHFSKPRNSGRLAEPDRVGVAGTPHRGPFLRLEVRLRDDVVVEARFQTHGCGPSIACGSVLTELVIGRIISDARSVTVADLIATLDGIPDDKRHCAELAIAALRDALPE
jgi:NifU-like protein involved in Fe-S cluster formation